MADMQKPLVSSHGAGLKVAVAGAKSVLGLGRSNALAGSCVRHLNGPAIHSIRASDGDPEGLDCDLLVLVGNCRGFHRYRALLRRRPESRPRVAIWQIDPLPPVEFDRQLEKRMLALSSVLGRSRLLRPVELIANRILCTAVAWHGFGPYSDRARGNFVDSTMARAAVEAYSFIRHGFSEGWLDHVFVSTIGKQEFLASRGIESAFAPAGLLLGEDRDQPRDIDVVFIGRLNKRARRRRLAALRQEIEKRGAKMVVVDNCYGEERTALLNRTKIVLHVHKNPWDTPWMRWVMAAECGCLVVSEPLSDPRPLEPGVHYVEARLDDLPTVIERLLASPADVLAMARRCASFAHEHLTAARSIGMIVSHSIDATRP
jgi:hypothetical protein